MCGGPKINDWKKNPDGCRSIEEAISLLAANNINLPDDVKLVLYEDLPPDVPAAYLLSSRCGATTQIEWETLLTDEGKVTIKVDPSVFHSDEKIIAVISHELFELDLLRRHLAENGKVLATQINRLISTTTTTKNFHCLAWKHGDQAVLEFRRRHS